MLDVATGNKYSWKVLDSGHFTQHLLHVGKVSTPEGRGREEEGQTRGRAGFRKDINRMSGGRTSSPHCRSEGKRKARLCLVKTHVKVKQSRQTGSHF